MSAKERIEEEELILMHNKDEIAQRITEFRKFAIKEVTQWLDKQLGDYKEPRRAGVPKGKSIGYPKRKFRAAYLMVLYPNGLDLQGISKLTGVSKGVLKVWRTQKTFEEAIEIGCRLVGKFLVKILDTNDLDESTTNRLAFIIEALPFFDKRVIYAVVKWMKGKLDSPVAKTELEYLVKMRVLGLAWLGLRVGRVHDKESLRNFERNPSVLQSTKKLIGSYIDNLLDYENVKSLTADQLKKYDQSLKEMVFRAIDNLAY